MTNQEIDCKAEIRRTVIQYCLMLVIETINCTNKKGPQGVKRNRNRILEKSDAVGIHRLIINPTAS